MPLRISGDTIHVAQTGLIHHVWDVTDSVHRAEMEDEYLETACDTIDELKQKGPERPNTLPRRREHVTVSSSSATSAFFSSSSSGSHRPAAESPEASQILLSRIYIARSSLEPTLKCGHIGLGQGTCWAVRLLIPIRKDNQLLQVSLAVSFGITVPAIAFAKDSGACLQLLALMTLMIFFSLFSGTYGLNCIALRLLSDEDLISECPEYIDRLAAHIAKDCTLHVAPTDLFEKEAMRRIENLGEDKKLRER